MAKGKELTTVLKFIGVQDKSVTKTITSITKGIGRMNSMVNKVIKATAVAATAIAGTAAAAATATTKALYDMGEGWKKASDTIRVGTGATGQQLAELNNSMQALYKQLPQSKAEIASTIADINTLTGASGTALEAYASNALKASHMLGVDVKTIYTEASKAFNAFNIPAEEMAGKLDHLFKVSQATGVGIDKLAQGAVMGQASFRTLGYSFEQATSLLGQLDKAGVRSETVLAALKKGAVELAQNGAKDLPRAFAAVANEIKNAKTETEAMTIAAKVFGARGGGEIAKALRDGRMSAEAFTKSLVESGESIDVAYQDTANFSERMKPLMHTLEVAVKPLADTVFAQINRFIPIVAGAVDKFVPLIAAKATELAKQVETGMTSAINYVQTIDFGAVLDNISATARKVGQTLAGIWAHRDTIAKYAKLIVGVVVAIKAAVAAVNAAQIAIKVMTGLQWAYNVALNANPIGLIVLAIGALISVSWLLYDNWDTIISWCAKQWQSFASAFPETARLIITCFEGVKIIFIAIWATIKKLGIGAWDAIKIVWNEAVAVFTTIGNLISNTFSTVFTVIEDIVSAIGALLRGDFSEAGEYIQKAFLDAFDGVKRNFAIVVKFFKITINNCKAFFVGLSDTIINMGSVAFGAVEQGLADLGVDWDAVTTKLQALWDKFRVYFELAMDTLKTLWSAVTAAFSGDWDGACGHLQDAWGKFKEFLAPSMQVLQQIWDKVSSAISSAWDSTCAKLKSAWEGIQGSFSGAWEGIKSAAAAAIDWLMDKIKPFLSVWDSVKGGVSWVADKIGLGGDEAEKTAQTQQVVEKMATGGFTRGLTLAGEAGTEAVISFDPRYRTANQGYLLTAAELLGMTSPVPSIAGGTTNSTHIELGGITFSPVIQAPTPASAASILDQLRAAVPDLADLLEDELAKRAAHRYA